MLTLTAISKADQDGCREYRLEKPDGTVSFITGASREEALTCHYERIIGRLQETVAKMTPTAPLAIVGQAIRAGGVAEIDPAVGYPREFVAAAKLLGYVAETHTVGTATYLRVGIDSGALDRLKGQLDRQAVK